VIGIGTLGVRLRAGTKCPKVFRIDGQGRWLKWRLWQLSLSLKKMLVAAEASQRRRSLAGVELGNCEHGRF
jgi:hypothetical protein